MRDPRYSQALDAQQVVFREGADGNCAYVIESGSVQISRMKNGADQTIAVLRAGDIVGEMALIDDQARSATATALEPTVLRVLTREYLAERVAQSDPLLRYLLRRVVQRLRAGLSSQAGPGVPAAAEKIDDDHLLAMGRMQASQAIQQGLEGGEFELHLQPIVALPQGVPMGFEALIRWNRPGVGYVSPLEFISLAEESDQIMAIGRWTLETACSHLSRIDKSLDRSGAPVLFVGVNLSGRQCVDPALFDLVKDSLQKYRIEPGRLKLEVTETVLIHNFDVAASVLVRCRDHGVKLALDDFGTGYSSLSYLNRFPVDMLKIDRAFVKEVVANLATQKMVRAVAGLGHDLGMAVLAEGIETAADARMLTSLGVDYGQGYLYGKAMTLDQALNYLGRETATA